MAWTGGSLFGLEASRPEPAADVHNGGGTVDLVPIVRPKTTLREVYQIDGQQDAQGNSWP